MSRSSDTLRSQILANMGPVFAPLEPIAGGFAAPLALAEEQVDDVIRASLLSDADSGWLDLVGEGDGIRRLASEDDDTYRARIGALPPGTSRADIKAAVDAVLTGAGFGPCAVYDRQNASYFAGQSDTASDELAVELFADGNNILIPARTVYVVAPDLGSSEALELAVCAAANRSRAAGFTIRVIFSDTLTPATGYSWSLA